MTDAMERRVDAALRAWGQAAVPVDELAGVGVRERKTVRVVERALAGVAQRRRHRAVFRRWGVPFASVAACFGLLLGGAFWYRDVSQREGQVASGSRSVETTYAEVRAVDGGVVARRNGVAELLNAGAVMRVGSGDVLSTPPDGRAQLGLDDGGRIELASATELAIPTRTPGVERFELKLGRVAVDVPPNPDRTRIVVVETPDVSVSVHGTSFVVDVHEFPGAVRPITSVAVSRGTVWVLRDGLRLAVLQAGERWTSGAKSTVLTSGESEPAPAGGAGLDVGATESSESGSSSRRAGARGKPRGATGALVAPTTSPDTHGSAADSDGADPVFALGSVVGSDQLRRENRQFQAALRERNSGDDRTAIAMFDEFLLTFPSSVLAQEARVERFRALKRLGRHHDAEQAARQYLADYDEGFARSEARDIALAPDAGSASTASTAK